MRSIATPPSAPDVQLRWSAVYRPAWKLVAVSAAVGIAGVMVTVAAAFVSGSDHLGLLFALLFVALLLWTGAVAGRAVRKGSAWRASLFAGAVALFTVLATWVLVLFVLFLIAVATLSAD